MKRKLLNDKIIIIRARRGSQENNLTDDDNYYIQGHCQPLSKSIKVPLISNFTHCRGNLNLDLEKIFKKASRSTLVDDKCYSIVVSKEQPTRWSTIQVLCSTSKPLLNNFSTELLVLESQAMLEIEEKSRQFQSLP